jgi:putative endonuclease
MMKCSDGTLYTGYTSDLKRRLSRHNSGQGSKYTRSRLPVALAYSEVLATRGEALRREIEIKRLSRNEKLLLCSTRLASRRHSIR